MHAHTHIQRKVHTERDRQSNTHKESQSDRQTEIHREKYGWILCQSLKYKNSAPSCGQLSLSGSLSLSPSLFFPPLSLSSCVCVCVCVTPTSLCWPSQLCHNPMVPWFCILHFFLTKVNLNKRRSTMGASFQGCNTSNLSTEKNKTKTLIFQWSAWISNEWINEVINRSSGKKRYMLQRETSPGDTLHLPNDTVSAARETAQSPSPGLYVKSLCSCHNSSTSVPYHPIRLKMFEY